MNHPKSKATQFLGKLFFMHSLWSQFFLLRWKLNLSNFGLAILFAFGISSYQVLASSNTYQTNYFDSIPTSIPGFSTDRLQADLYLLCNEQISVFEKAKLKEEVLGFFIDIQTKVEIFTQDRPDMVHATMEIDSFLNGLIYIHNPLDSKRFYYEIRALRFEKSKIAKLSLNKIIYK